jgi:hypothetical protein
MAHGAVSLAIERAAYRLSRARRPRNKRLETNFDLV